MNEEFEKKAQETLQRKIGKLFMDLSLVETQAAFLNSQLELATSAEPKRSKAKTQRTP
ncbi:hypothetical protein G8E10_09650 [Rhizobiaceae bacterium CRRU44]|uniref:Uncharacterized protein n=1 Tax=Ferranicluibacter rubi TaxID=2715133 RepID=A0AA43ZFD9_9HYPH|nr:hypothetical protein [Ferranicluibacter rubi]NHT75938.1 hypothetical protein [Ferranicluibacter rubi]NHT75998.1 hypothetical protein [Ferranicluibacter rubi]